MLDRRNYPVCYPRILFKFIFGCIVLCIRHVYVSNLQGAKIK